MLCWLLLLSSLVLAGSLPGAEAAATSFRMCGVHLADFLSLVCQDLGYNDPYATATSRHKRSVGIVDECCRRACSLQVWRSYCAQPDSSPATSTVDNSNAIADSEEGRLRTEGRDLLRRLQAQVRGQGQTHRPRPNRCSCRKERKKLSRKKMRAQLARGNKRRAYEVGTIRPYYENNQVISPIEQRSFFLKQP